jgi:hypothetical protein
MRWAIRSEESEKVLLVGRSSVPDKLHAIAVHARRNKKIRFFIEKEKSLSRNRERLGENFDAGRTT